MPVPEPSWAVLSRGPKGTHNLARRLGAVLPTGSVLALRGDLGAGKTTLIQGLAEGLGVTEPVVSPTFALMNLYQGACSVLVHVDFFRLDDPDSVRALGIEENFGRADAVVAVEWADKLPELFAPNTIWIDLAWWGPRARKITVHGLPKPRGIRLQVIETDE